MGFIFQDLAIIKQPGLWRPFRLVSFPRNRLIVWCSYWCDARAFGQDARGWRRTSLLLHILNATLLGMLSPLAGLLFLVHPLTIMGSSYIAGRSGLLSGTAQIASVVLALNGHAVVACVIAAICTIWLKPDSAVFFLMIGLLSWLKIQP